MTTPQSLYTAVFIPLLLFLSAAAAVAGDSRIPGECELVIDDFADGISSHWTVKSFAEMTEYVWEKDDDRPYVRASSNGAASGLYYEIEYDPRQYPFITWQWQVDNIIAAGDATKKSGDDYAARIYVVFPAFFFWNTRAINYIWANKLPKDSAVPNTYTDNAYMISVQSGPAETGRWITETRNVFEDYRRVFGTDPPKVGAVAIMTDTDDTGARASARYGPIAACRQKP